MANTKFPILASGAKEAYSAKFLAQSQEYLSALLGNNISKEKCLSIIERMVDFIIYLHKLGNQQGLPKTYKIRSKK